MRFPLLATLLSAAALSAAGAAIPFDAAPFARSLPEGNGLYWDDPRELHRVVVHFKEAAPAADQVKLEYWGSKWPEQHLPKDKPTGAGSSGWMELGNWYRGGWRTADTAAATNGNVLVFTFHPVNAKEAPKLKGYAADFRYTLKVRLVPAAAAPMPAVDHFEAFTDSALAEQLVHVAFAVPAGQAGFKAFNGRVVGSRATSDRDYDVTLLATTNSDPNTFDRTLVTCSNSDTRFTFGMDDLKQGPVFVPVCNAAIFPANDSRNYMALLLEQRSSPERTLYDRVAEMPEQTWRAAWEGMPPKRSPIYFPLGWEGGRQRFRLNGDGSIQFRSNDGYFKARPGQDTPRLVLEAPHRHLRFNLPGTPLERGIDDDSVPICRSVWEENGVRVEQTALITPLGGMNATALPPSDATAVFMARFILTNPTNEPRVARFRMKYDDSPEPLRVDTNGFIWVATNCHGHISVDGKPELGGDTLRWVWPLAPGESKTVVLKFSYLMLPDPAERAAAAALDFNRERAAITSYWRQRLDESAHLLTREPMLNQLYRAFAAHQLINCEREPNAARRFARVGSFGYGAYGNESCMMVTDLERRGYHREAQECLDAWLHYQGTVGLPGDFSTHEGVLYGAGGYEAGGYNQHHGWILWCLAEHFRYTRDTNWLSGAAPGLVKGADWIIGQCERTKSRDDLSRGLLPSGTLEDIGDWWTWLSTSCYTWRGLDSAAWALEQIKHSEAARIRREADAFRIRMLQAFFAAAERSPVVRLRDGTAVPHIPSYVERRGRSFGWICETLEGSIHLLITRALPPKSKVHEFVMKDYEDNLFLSKSYGYTIEDFDRYWFGRGGMSMQACLLLDVEPYLYRDQVKHALRAMFNAIAVSHFPDVHMNTEHALPNMGDFAGDHYKTSDEANATGWLRQILVREDGDDLLIGQAVPRDWLADGKQCGLSGTATYFGKASVLYLAGNGQISASVEGPKRNPPKTMRVRFREPGARNIAAATVNGKPWTQFKGEWVDLPGNIGSATVVATF